MPADVKSAFDALKKDVDALAPKLRRTPRRRPRRRRRRRRTPRACSRKIGQAKNGLMAGMWPGEQTMKAYADAKTQAPKAIADLNAVIAKAAR